MEVAAGKFTAVSFAAFPCKGACTGTKVVKEIADICCTRRIFLHAFACIYRAVKQGNGANFRSVLQVVFEGAEIVGAVGIFVFTDAVLCSHAELAVVVGFVGKGVSTRAVMNTVNNVTAVNTAVGVGNGGEACTDIVDKAAVINVAVFVGDFAVTVTHNTLEVAFIYVAVGVSYKEFSVLGF